MAQSFATQPIEDSVAKVNNEVAVGEDLEFQRKWWRFEKGVWIVFAIILVLDVAGVFGRGWFAKQQRSAADGSIHLKYDRIERASTPSIMTVNFSQSSIHNGEASLFVSNSIVKELGAQRVIPSPRTTVIGDDGLTYTFAAGNAPASVELALEPSGPGVRHFAVQVPGSPAVQGDIVVVP